LDLTYPAAPFSESALEAASSVSARPDELG
jgi:hypothetical protein